MPLQNKNGLVKVRVNVATKRKTVSSFFDDGRRIQIAIAMLFSCCQAYLRQYSRAHQVNIVKDVL